MTMTASRNLSTAVGTRTLRLDLRHERVRDYSAAILTGNLAPND